MIWLAEKDDQLGENLRQLKMAAADGNQLEQNLHQLKMGGEMAEHWMEWAKQAQVAHQALLKQIEADTAQKKEVLLYQLMQEKLGSTPDDQAMLDKLLAGSYYVNDTLHVVLPLFFQPRLLFWLVPSEDKIVVTIGGHETEMPAYHTLELGTTTGMDGVQVEGWHTIGLAISRLRAYYGDSAEARK